MAKRVTLRASDVAAMIGRHTYKSREEIFNDYWKKYSPGTFTGQTQRDRANVALQASPLAREVLDRVSQLTPKDSTEVQNIVDNVRKHITSDANLTPEQKAEVISHITSNVYTSHGTRSEDKTSDKVAADEGARLVRDNAFYSYELCTIGQTKFVVTGKIDRIEEREDGSRILVEIKNRTNRLFRRVVEYEMIQVQVYLQMLGLVHARLVEQYNNQVLSHDISRDEELWTNTIVPALERFCQELHEKF
jgi:PD-(D/E)XK nuclease superfamily